jgi:hypothetical protein
MMMLHHTSGNARRIATRPNSNGMPVPAYINAPERLRQSQIERQPMEQPRPWWRRIGGKGA